MTRTPVRLRSVLRLEQLERRDAPATLVGNNKVTYQDADGDNVTVTLSKPILNAGNVNSVFAFSTGTVNQNNATKQQLQAIDLTGIGAAATGVNITTAAIASKVTGGDGFAALGHIDATGIDLGAVKVDGDLGRIRAGDATATTIGLKGLTVHSMGRFGTNTGAPDLNTQVQGKLNFLNVKSDVKEAFIDVQGGVDGKLGSVFIGGSLIGGTGNSSGRISSIGAMGAVRIAGNIQGGGGTNSGQIFTGGSLAGVTIGGSLIGGGNSSGLIFSIGAMGAVRIAGNIQGGGGTNSGEISSSSTLAGVTIGGSLIGGFGSFSGRISSFGAMGAVRIIGDLVGGSASGADELEQSGFIQGQRIAALTIGRSLIAGTDATTGTFTNNGAVRVADDIGSITIGNIVGNPTNSAVIAARGNAAFTPTTDIAIGSLRVNGRVEFAQILAGFNTSGTPVNADAQIGSVFVGGDWIASSIAAGALVTNAFFGDADDAKMAGAGVKDLAAVSSRIKSLTILGQAPGTVGGTDHFGIVAENVGAVRIGGTPLVLTAGDDDLLIGITGDFKVNEI